MSEHSTECPTCESGRINHGLDYLICQGCGAHFVTSLQSEGRCFDCREVTS